MRAAGETAAGTRSERIQLKTSIAIAVIVPLVFANGCVGLWSGEDNQPVRAGMGMGARVMSSPQEITVTNGGFNVTQRAGVDQLAGDPTWETMSRQKILVAAKDLCASGVASIRREDTPVRSIEFGTSRDLVYDVRCK